MERHECWITLFSIHELTDKFVKGDRTFFASRCSTLILVNITHPYSEPDTSIERVQPQKFQLKNNLENATDGHKSSKNNMRQ